MIDAAIARFCPNYFKPFARALQDVPLRLVSKCLAVTHLDSPAPLFVLGNQKSGTTAIAALLAKAAGKSLTMDIFFRIRSHVQLSLVRQELAFADFVRRYKLVFAADIVKEPNLTFYYDDLAECFPRSVFVMVMRDPRDNIRSMLDRVKIPGHLDTLDTVHMESLPGYLWRLAIDGVFPPIKGDNYVETLAHRWNVAASVYEANADNIELIRFEDFLKDKVGTITDVARRVGLDPIHEIENVVDVQYQPRGNREVSWADFFGRDNLTRIEAICGEKMEQFDYETSNTQIMKTTGS